MTDAELQQSIPWEAEQYVPFDLHEIEVDFHVTDKSWAATQMDVLLIAAKKTVLHGYASAISDAGLKPVVADVAMLALTNLVYERDPLCFEQLPVVCVDIQPHQIEIGILLHGTCVFSRSIADIRDTRDVQAGSVEIMRAVDFFSATSMNPSIERLLITGNSVSRKDYRACIEETWKMKVEVIDPLKNLSVHLPHGQDAAQLAKECVAIGLAYRTKNDRIENQSQARVNLLHSKTNEVKTFAAQYASLEKAKVALFLAAGLSVLFAMIVAATMVGNFLSK